MSSYTQEELQGMSRVQLRRAAIEVLKIDNKEASNAKSVDLIERIMELGGNGNGNGTEKAAAKTAKRTTSRRGSVRKAAVAEETAEEAVSVGSNGLGKLVDAVGKAVDETKEEISAKLSESLENQEHIMKQQYMLFGLLCDIFKAVNEPDELEERLQELEEEWTAQGNEG
jgi:flagellar biosynthesis/type III secretory pathway ATPase